MRNACFIAAVLCLTTLLHTARAGNASREDDTFKVFADAAGRAYFPKDRESYYTRYLAAMKEPSLMPQPKSADAFALRFTWLRSFHDPIAVRIWRDGDQYRIRAVRLARQQDYRPGPPTNDATRPLTKVELAEIQRMTKANDLWKPLNEQELLATGASGDGSQWIFERLNQRDYSMLDLWSPTGYGIEEYKKHGVDVSKIRDFKAFVRLGLYLLRITKLTPNDDDIY